MRLDHATVPYSVRTLESSGKERSRKGTGTVYRIVVRGELSRRLAIAFEGMAMEATSGKTILTGEIIDQSHLHGILARIGSLGLDLVSVHPVTEGVQEENYAAAHQQATNEETEKS